MPFIVMHKLKQSQENGSMFTLVINKNKWTRTHIYITHPKRQDMGPDTD